MGQPAIIPRAIALDPAGDVAVAGKIVTNPGHDDHTDRDFVVAKLGGADGAERWRTLINGTRRPFDPDDPSANYSPIDEALPLDVDAAGDVIAAGDIADTGTPSFSVVKLGGTDGVETWRFRVPSTYGIARAVALGAAGDVVAAGEVNAVPVVVALSAGGSLRWQTPIANVGRGTATGLAVTADGDAIAIGERTSPTGMNAFAVRLAAADGIERWRYEPATPRDRFEAIALAAGDDPLVTGAAQIADQSSQQDFFVTRLDVLTGAERWRVPVAGEGGIGDFWLAIAALPAGGVGAAGTRVAGGQSSDAAVVRLAEADGTLESRAPAEPRPGAACCTRRAPMSPTGRPRSSSTRTTT